MGSEMPAEAEDLPYIISHFSFADSSWKCNEVPCMKKKNSPPFGRGKFLSLLRYKPVALQVESTICPCCSSIFMVKTECLRVRKGSLLPLFLFNDK